MPTPDTMPCTAASVIRAGMLLKLTAAGVVSPLGTSDAVSLLFGVAANDAFTGYGVDVQTSVGSFASFYSDGTIAISAGDALGPSATVAGAVLGGSSKPVARALRGAPSTLGAPVLGLLSGPGAAGGADPLAGIFAVADTGTVDKLTAARSKAQFFATGGSGLSVDEDGATVAIKTFTFDRFVVNNAGDAYPASDAAGKLGTAAFRWKSVYSGEYLTSLQQPSLASAMTINPDATEQVYIALGATAISSLAISAPTSASARVLRVLVAQDATGSRTIPTTWTGVKFAGGTYTATATADKTDVLTFCWDGVGVFWRETSRALDS